MGGPLRVLGHGGRDRVVMGAVAAGDKPMVVAVSCRRYLCIACGCVMLVVPREVGALRRYTLITIALSLASFGAGASATRIRARFAPGETFEEGWPSLRRWCRAVAEGRLFRWIRGVSELEGRRLAERVSVVIAEASGIGARHASFEARVIAGVMSSSSS